MMKNRKMMYVPIYSYVSMALTCLQDDGAKPKQEAAECKQS